MQLFTFDFYYFLQADQMPNYGDWVCQLADRWGFQLFPSSLTLKTLTDEMAGGVPFVGKYLVFKVINNIWDLLWCVCTYKVIKIMPGKF